MSSLRVPMRGLQHRPPHQAKRSHPVFSSHRPQLRGPNPAWNLGDSVWRSVQKRRFHWWPVVAPPLIFTGLFIGLWCWKCTMLVLFQNMIIYNPFLPPNARSLRIQDYQRDCRGVCWREERIRSLDGTEIALCVSDVSPIIRDEREGNLTQGRLVYILYFQGNASSLPPRLPDLSRILQRLAEDEDTEKVRYRMVCLSYRGYWTSHDRPSESGIDQDAEAALRWIRHQHSEQHSQLNVSPRPVVILYGSSIGCGFATNLAAKSQALLVNGLVLETPFTSTRDMLKALYPQKWLPYQYLWPFLRSHLDSWTNLGTIARAYGSKAPLVHIVEAGKDELVPAALGEQLYRRCIDLGLSVERAKISGALHNDTIVRPQGKAVIKQAIASIVSQC